MCSERKLKELLSPTKTPNVSERFKWKRESASDHHPFPNSISRWRREEWKGK